MTCSEDAAELGVEHVLCHHPGTEEFRVKVRTEEATWMCSEAFQSNTVELKY